MSELNLNDKEIDMLAKVQSKLIQSFVETSKIAEKDIKSWDKITWGRSSSKEAELGRFIKLEDKLEIGLDQRLATQ